MTSVKEVLSNILEHITPIDTSFSSPTLSSVRKGEVTIVRIIDRIHAKAKEAGSSLIFDETGKTASIWTGTQYEVVETKQLRDFLTNAAIKAGIPDEEARCSSFRDRLAKQIKDSVPDDALDGEKRYLDVILYLRNAAICFKADGTFEVEAPVRTIIPTASIFSDYNSEATCPLFDEMLQNAVPEECARAVLYEYLACILIPFGHAMEPNLQKCAFIIGEKDTGKSVLVKVLEALLGTDQTIKRKLSTLTTPDTFLINKLENRLLCICNDTCNKINNIDQFKSMVSGEAAEANVKNKEEVELKHYAKLLVIGNSYPVIRGDDPAFYKRVLPIPFVNSVNPEHQDTKMAQKILQNELAGIVNHIIEAMKRLLVNGCYTHSDVIERAWKEYAYNAGHIEEYLQSDGYSRCAKGGTEQKELYAGYSFYCKENHYSDALSYREFGNAMERLGYQMYTPGGKRAFHLTNGSPSTTTIEDNNKDKQIEIIKDGQTE